MARSYLLVFVVADVFVGHGIVCYVSLLMISNNSAVNFVVSVPAVILTASAQARDVQSCVMSELLHG